MNKRTATTCSKPSRIRGIRDLFLTGVVIGGCALATLAAGTAIADEVVRNGNRFQGVTVRGIDDGNLIYRAPAGDVRVPLEEVEVLVLDNTPKLAEAMEAFTAGRMRSAESTFREVFDGAQVPWIKQFTGFYLVQAHDQRGEAVNAAQVYIYLATSGADQYLLSKPPLASLNNANDNVKLRIRDEIMAVINDTQGESRNRLRDYLRRVSGEENVPDIEPDAGDLQQQARVKSAVILPASVWKLYEELRRGEQNADRWDAIKLLSEGKNEEAMTALEPWLDTALDLPEKLYLLGRIKLAIADKTEEREDYLDAGLAFMRLYAHYGPDAGRNVHALVYPAQLELAYIHQQIGRDDLFRAMMSNAGALVNNAENYPEYRKRYYQILGEEVPPVEPEDAE